MAPCPLSTIAGVQKLWNAATVKGIVSALALALLAGGGGPEQSSEQNYTKINVAIVADTPSRSAPVPIPDTWNTCERPSYSSTGNRWWAGFAACEGDVRIDVEADSINLGGPAVRMTIRTRSCPAGRGAGGGYFDRAVFGRPFEAQLVEIKRIVRQSLAQIDEACGGPAHASGLLGRQFDEEFLDLARSKWLRPSAADRRRSWES
jgi:hypothetical protein